MGRVPLRRPHTSTWPDPRPSSAVSIWPRRQRALGHWGKCPRGQRSSSPVDEQRGSSRVVVPTRVASASRHPREPSAAAVATRPGLLPLRQPLFARARRRLRAAGTSRKRGRLPAMCRRGPRAASGTWPRPGAESVTDVIGLIVTDVSGWTLDQVARGVVPGRCASWRAVRAPSSHHRARAEPTARG